MTGVAVGAIVLILLAGTGILGASAIGVPTTAELVLGAYVIGFALVVSLVLTLSAVDGMDRASLVAGSAALAGAGLGVWLLRGAQRPPWPSRSAVFELVRSPPVLAVAAVAALGFTYVIALLVATPPNGWDPLNYHLARAALWLEAGAVGYVESAYDERINFNPPNGEIAMTFVLGVTRQEVLAGSVQLVAAVVCAVGVFALARRLGLQRGEAVFGSLLFLTLPIVVLQASTTKNDLVVASFLVVSAVFVLGESRHDAALTSVAVALAVGTKFTAAYGVILLACLALFARRRGLVPMRLLALGAGTALGAYWYAVNALETGEVLGDQSNTPGLTAPLKPAENLVSAVGLVVDTLDLSGGKGSDILLYLVGAVVIAAGFLLIQGRGAWRSSLVAGAIVAAPLVLYLITTYAGRPTFVRVYEALGSPQAYLAEGDEIASSATTASDTASWYGPVGLLLVIGTGVVTVILVRRGSLPRLGLVMAAAPFVWLVLVALTLTYHPWQGRFFVFAVALSASLWGLTLRAPPVAWGLTLLAATTVLLSIVNFVEKPSGVRLLDRRPAVSVWELERWQVQSQHDPPIGSIFQALEENVPVRDSIALALGANDFGYPVFGPHLERRVTLVPFGSNARAMDSKWLLTNEVRAEEIDRTCWREVFRSDRGALFARDSAACGSG